MVKKIIHIGDIHLRTYKRHNEFVEIANKFFSEISELPYESEEIRIVIAGDLVHQKITVSNELFQILSWFLNECAKIAKTIIIAGNHDLLENNKDRLDSISPIVDLMRNPNIFYYKDSMCYEDDNIMWCVYSIFEENKKPDFGKKKKDKTYVGLYHAPIMGAVTDMGFTFDDGLELEMFEGCDMVIMGDIHSRQRFDLGGIVLAYVGSFIQQNYGESIDGHGYLIWDVEKKDYEEFDISTNYGYYQFRIRNITDIDDDREVLLNG